MRPFVFFLAWLFCDIEVGHAEGVDSGPDAQPKTKSNLEDNAIDRIGLSSSMFRGRFGSTWGETARPP